MSQSFIQFGYLFKNQDDIEMTGAIEILTQDPDIVHEG
jgi:hypothetical protein